MPRRYCRDCGADGPLHGANKEFCRACQDARDAARLLPCAGCGQRAPDKARLRVEGAERLYCPACAGPAKAAAQGRVRERWARLSKKAKTAPTRCLDGGPHRFVDLVAAYDERGRRGDTGRCAACGLERFWAWPESRASQWTSLRRRERDVA